MKRTGAQAARIPGRGPIRAAPAVPAPHPAISMRILLEFFMNWWYIYEAKAKIYPVDIIEGISRRTASDRTSANYCERRQRMSRKSGKTMDIIIICGFILKAIPIWKLLTTIG